MSSSSDAVECFILPLPNASLMFIFVASRVAAVLAVVLRFAGAGGGTDTPADRISREHKNINDPQLFNVLAVTGLPEIQIRLIFVRQSL